MKVKVKVAWLLAALGAAGAVAGGSFLLSTSNSSAEVAISVPPSNKLKVGTSNGAGATGGAKPIARGQANVALLRGVDHADFTVDPKGAGVVNYAFDKGVLNVISPTSLTLTRADSTKLTLTLTSSTAFVNTSQSQLALDLSGSITVHVAVISSNGIVERITGPKTKPGLSSDSGQATSQTSKVSPLLGLEHASLERYRSGTGVVTTEVDRGRVTKISSSSITIQHRDSTTVTLAISSSTGFGSSSESQVSTSLVGKTKTYATVISQNGMAREVLVLGGKGSVHFGVGSSGKGSSSSTGAQNSGPFVSSGNVATT